jgi:hypothetical protein
VGQPRFPPILTNAYLLAACLHLLTVFPWFSGINERLSLNTAYSVGAYDVGGISRRATGFFNSPGQLSLFAIGGLSLGVGGFRSGLFGRRQTLAMISLVLGFAALSRSFFVTCSVIAFIYVFTASLRAKLQFALAFCLGGVVMLRNDTFVQYFALIWERLGSITDVTLNDRLAGETGLFEALKVLLRYPYFGNMVSIEGNALMAWNGEMLVRPHTSVVLILAYYGLFLSFPLFLLLAKACSSASKIMKTVGRSVFLNPQVLGFVAVNIVCLVEPLMETAVYFLFLFGVIGMGRNLLLDKKDAHNLTPGITGGLSG